jgi:DNA helicase-2/ATP-dependent DNA helicase PcrA
MISKHRIKSSDILNLTFTNAAATEMVDRVGIADAKKVFRTFHSFALDLLQMEKEHLPFKVGDFILPSYGQDFQLLKDLMRLYPAITSFRSLRDRIVEWKNSDVDPAQAIEDTYGDKKGNEFFYAAAYRDYEKKCREQGWLDFDGLIKEAVKLLETNDAVRTKYQRPYIAVDECQDTNSAQFRLLQLIYGGNIFAVGDENQLIFEFRSAVAGNLTNFAQHFPGSITLFLGNNYRSTGALVEFFKKIIPVDNGLASHMVSMRERGVDPTFTQYDDDLQEVVHVLYQINEAKDLNNTAIIARTNRQLRTFQKAAMALGIKTMILGQKDLWQKDEVKHLLELTKKFKDSGRKAYDVMEEQMRLNNLTHIYRNAGGPNEKPPVENLADIVKLSANRGTVKEFLDWLRKLTYACEAAKSPSYEHRDKNPTLTLTTVHQAKGREYKNVYVIGCKQGTMPHKEGEILEEKRIFFVAASRAADNLHISFDTVRSEFLNDFQEEIKYHEQKPTEKPEPTPVGATVGQAGGATIFNPR